MPLPKLESHKTEELKARMVESTQRIMQEAFANPERTYISNLPATKPESFPGFDDVCVAQAEFHPRKPLEKTVFYVIFADSTTPNGIPPEQGARPKDIIITVATTHPALLQPTIEYSVQLNRLTDQLTVKHSAKQRMQGESDVETISTLLNQLDTKCHEGSLTRTGFTPILGEQERIWTRDT